jgi:hypothetical protein
MPVVSPRRDPSRRLVPLDGASQTVAGTGAPDLIHPVVGYRQWRIHDGELRSVHTWDRWHAGTMTARCHARTRHAEPAPVQDCSCGLYARYAPFARTASAGTPDLVAGAVALWGHLELHAHGMRAEHAAIIALALPVLPGRKRGRVQEVARRLGVPTVAPRRLQEAALRQGAPIPASLRPPDTTPNKRAAPGTPDPARLHAAADRGDGR